MSRPCRPSVKAWAVLYAWVAVAVVGVGSGVAQVAETNTVCFFYDTAMQTRFRGRLVQPGDTIDAYDPQGVWCGRFVVNHPGTFGYMPVYGNDASTTADEGALSGDTIRFRINGVAALVTRGVPRWADGTQVDVTLEVPELALRFSTQPAGAINRAALRTQPVVRALIGGALDTSFTDRVSLTLGLGSGQLAGTLTVKAVAGVAAFGDVAYTGVADGERFSLVADDETSVGDDYPVGASDTLGVDVVSTSLAFSVQPAGAVNGTPLRAQPVVAARDGAGLLDTGFAETVGLRATALTGSGVLSGSTSVRAFRGQAVFSDLRYDAGHEGDSFVLVADDEAAVASDLPAVPSNAVVARLQEPSVSCTWDLAAGWHLVSLPCQVDDARLATLFPGALSLFGFRGAYYQASALQPGAGYWLHLAAPLRVTITGRRHPAASLRPELAAHWNLIGPGDVALEVPALRQAWAGLGLVSGYDQAYVAVTRLDPGQGYWANLAAAATIDLTGAVAAVGGGTSLALPPADPLLSGSRLAVAGQGQRQDILLGASSAVGLTELPPPPPAGAFDARVRVDGADFWAIPDQAAAAMWPLRLQGPVEQILWQIQPGEDAVWALALDGQLLPLAGAGRVSVAPGTAVQVRRLVPATPALQGNYPNPFNGQTRIRFSLATAASAELALYDLAGQRVTTVFRGGAAAGAHELAWDGCDAQGRAVASGVYLCRLQAADRTEARPLVLLR